MELSRTMLAAAAALVIGVLIGMALTASGRSALEARLEERETAAEAMAKVEAAVDALEGRVNEVEAAVAALGTSHASGIEGLGQRIEGVGDELAGAVAKVESNVSAALSERIEGVGDDLAGAMAKVESGVSAALSERLQGLLARVEPAAREATQEAEDVPVPGGGGELIRVGETADFGEARVFLSALDTEAGRARVAINGAETQVLEQGTPVAVGGCTVMLTGFEDGGARIAGECGGGAPQGTGEGTAIAVGGTGALADGKLRVFMSGFDADAGTARVAVNGTETIELRMSEPVKAGGCDVTLTGIGGGTATIDAAC